ncbi:hypothetical protein [Aeromicrobium sp. Leaf350]|uniref:hypothetical protein n=1 Tax=Aeromicrobium sp. Leaf350 TaxID=2876565 RepID=UPI001E630E1F|nr:hypothetical protein [Aeromicrobium sp. Leaf350]
MADTDSYAGPSSPELRERWRRDRRSIVRLHHPDRGGDPALLQQELRENDAFYRDLDQPRHHRGDVIVTARPGVLVRAVRAVRASLTRGRPGRRHYFDL